MKQPVLRIAMWSGPRNISTAMMRAWENRPDAFVSDEPLYAHYLAQTGFEHPGREATLAAHETNWQKVVDWLLGPVPNNTNIWYQKHMAHHLLPNVGREWIVGLTNCFLIRDPREMLTSLLKFIPKPRVEDTGLPQQVDLFEQIVAESGQTPIVVDGKDVLLNPEQVLKAICDRIGIEFSDKMLSWPPGRRETDGAWAPEWYERVEQTTGFGTYQPKEEQVPEELNGVYEECLSFYQRLEPHKLAV